MQSLIAISGTSIRNQNGLFSLNDLHKASGGANKHKPNLWMSNKQTAELVEEIEKAGIPAIYKKQGLGTFVCKELVVHYGMWISPQFSLKVIQAFLDNTVSDKINSQQQYAIKEAVTRCVASTGRTFQSVYRSLYNHFKVPRYQDLLAKDFNAAMTFLGASAIEREVDIEKYTARELGGIRAISYRNESSVLMPFDLSCDADYVVRVRKGKIGRYINRLVSLGIDYDTKWGTLHS